MRSSRRFVLGLALLAMLLVLEAAAAKSSQYQTGFVAWRAADGGFATWSVEGVALTAAGELALDPTSAASESDPIPSSNGHLAVLVGFDAQGNPVVNDPAAASDGEVTRTYDRAELESLWLETSGGTAYLIYPPGHAVPEL